MREADAGPVTYTPSSCPPGACALPLALCLIPAKAVTEGAAQALELTGRTAPPGSPAAASSDADRFSQPSAYLSVSGE